MQGVPVLLFTDFGSPFCWLVETVMARLQDEGRVTVEHRAFELRPSPAPLGAPPPVADAHELAAALGLRLRQPATAVRTRKAHELARMARGHGVERVVRDAIYAAYFDAGRDIGRIDVLVELARGAGLDATEARVVLDIDTHAAAIERETAQAAGAGMDAVPVAVIGNGERRIRVDGALPVEEWRRVVERATRDNQSND